MKLSCRHRLLFAPILNILAPFSASLSAPLQAVVASTSSLELPRDPMPLPFAPSEFSRNSSLKLNPPLLHHGDTPPQAQAAGAMSATDRGQLRPAHSPSLNGLQPSDQHHHPLPQPQSSATPSMLSYASLQPPPVSRRPQPDFERARALCNSCGNLKD